MSELKVLMNLLNQVEDIMENPEQAIENGLSSGLQFEIPNAKTKSGSVTTQVTWMAASASLALLSSLY